LKEVELAGRRGKLERSEGSVFELEKWVFERISGTEKGVRGSR
jgi:hypothetical protein